MLVTTTPIIEGKRIVKYYGIVSGETIIGANVFRDLFASIRDIVGGRSGAYEEVLRMAKDTALQEMQAQAAKLGANAVIGVDLDYETVGGSGSMLMVTANGTAVTIEEVLRMAKDTALQEMQAQAAKLGANAVIGVDLDYETVGGSGSMLMVTANGTAVTIED